MGSAHNSGTGGPQTVASARRQARRPGRQPLLSPLTRRILAVNLIAPLLLLVGLLYLDEYEQALLSTEDRSPAGTGGN